MHRYLLDRNAPSRIEILPLPMALTEAPETYRDLGRRRARWYRGLLQTIRTHRAMLFRRRFQRVGLFALLYQLAFEILAPIIEFGGYLLLLAGLMLGRQPLVQQISALLLLTIAANFCISTRAVMLCLSSPAAPLVRYRRLREVALLLVTVMLSNFGYRQFLAFSQLRGFFYFVRGRGEWGNALRQGIDLAADR